MLGSHINWGHQDVRASSWPREPYYRDHPYQDDHTVSSCWTYNSYHKKEDEYHDNSSSNTDTTITHFQEIYSSDSDLTVGPKHRPLYQHHEKQFATSYPSPLNPMTIAPPPPPSPVLSSSPTPPSPLVNGSPQQWNEHPPHRGVHPGQEAGPSSHRDDTTRYRLPTIMTPSPGKVVGSSASQDPPRPRALSADDTRPSSMPQHISCLFHGCGYRSDEFLSSLSLPTPLDKSSSLSSSSSSVVTASSCSLSSSYSSVSPSSPPIPTAKPSPRSSSSLSSSSSSSPSPSSLSSAVSNHYKPNSPPVKHRKSPSINQKNKPSLPPSSKSSPLSSNSSRSSSSPPYPSRILIVHADPPLSIGELHLLYDPFGGVRRIQEGTVMFYDVRDAEDAQRHTYGSVFKGREVTVRYATAKEVAEYGDANQGTLVVFNLTPSMSNADVKTIFQRWGEIREIRETPHKRHHRFVEYFDVREAEHAMRGMNRTDLNGKRIKIEPSRPGSRRCSHSHNMGNKHSPANNNTRRSNNHSLPSAKDNNNNTVSDKSGGRNSDHPNSKVNYNSKNLPLEDRMGDQRRSGPEYGLDVHSVARGDDERTTLMVKNIPNKYTQDMLLREIEGEFQDQFDFLYLPIDFKNECNLGYAFINFIDPRTIVSFYCSFNRRKWEHFNSDKVCQLSYARIQGKEALMRLRRWSRNNAWTIEKEEP